MTAWRANPAPGIFLGQTKNAALVFDSVSCCNRRCRLCRARAGLHSCPDSDRNFYGRVATRLRGYPTSRAQRGRARSDADEYAYPDDDIDSLAHPDRFEHADPDQHPYGHAHADTHAHADAQANLNPLSYPIRQYHAN